VSFGEEKRGANLEEKEGALHEGLRKTLESLRRSFGCLELAWRVFPWSLSLHFLRGSIFMEEGRI
jgi:hypothetical protein